MFGLSEKFSWQVRVKWPVIAQPLLVVEARPEHQGFYCRFYCAATSSRAASAKQPGGSRGLVHLVQLFFQGFGAEIGGGKKESLEPAIPCDLRRDNSRDAAVVMCIPSGTVHT